LFRAVLVGTAIVATTVGTASTASADPMPTAPMPFVTCGPGTYQNVADSCGHNPTQGLTPPPGATALCRDGDYSFNARRARTCADHGGVAEWLMWV
jgi:hypothetical protein